MLLPPKPVSSGLLTLAKAPSMFAFGTPASLAATSALASRGFLSGSRPPVRKAVCTSCSSANEPGFHSSSFGLHAQ